jgi:cardiolipin synthase
MPDAAMMDALKIAALAGIDVHLMIPDRPDHPLVYPATLSYADELAKVGVNVHIYEGGFLHAKTLLVDDELASVGTANFDYRSFRLNFEVNAFIYDVELGKRMAAIYDRDLLQCRPFDHDQVYRRPFVGHVKEAVSRLVAPLL